MTVVGVGCDKRAEVVTDNPGAPHLGGLVGPRVLESQMRDGVACFYFINQGARVGLLFPAGWSARTGPPPEIVDETGAVVARTGGQYWIGGGFLPEVPDQLQGCADDEAFVAGEFFLRDPTSR